MNINKNLMSRNHTALKRSKADIQYIVIHYVGALGDAKANTDYYKSTNVGASADFWVGHSGDIWQGNDYYNYYSWHCGGGRQSSQGGTFYGKCTNKNSIGIEMCVKKKSTKTMNATDSDWYFTDATVSATVELVKSLMAELNIDADHVIRHMDVNGKYCPNPYVDSIHKGAWAAFKARLTGTATQTAEVTQSWYRVRKSWTDTNSQKGAYSNLDNAKAECDKWYGYSVYNADGEAIYTSAATQETGAAGIPSSKQAYIDAVAAIAVDLYKTTKILPSVVIAQSCLETGYGLGSDSTALVQVNNLLGMKADLINSTWSEYSVWNGEKLAKNTPEYYNGKLTYITDYFRKYTDYRNCITDYEMFLLHVRNNSGLKYAKVAGMTDPKAVITAISQGGYATDSSYITKVMKLISENGFTKYDEVVQGLTEVNQDSTKTKTEETKMTFNDALNKIINEIETSGHEWVYYNSKISSTFANALKNKNYHVNCNMGVCWALMMVGDLTEGNTFWGKKDGTVVWRNSSKTLLEKAGYSFTNVDGKKTVKQALRDGTIKAGDIVTYVSVNHTNAYMGNGVWFDTGHGYNGGTGDGVRLKVVHGSCIYNNYKIGYVIRKGGVSTTYRVRVGIYSDKTVMNNTAALLKKKGFDTFPDEVATGTALYCGSFTVKEYAENRKNALTKIKVSGKYLVPVIDEV